MRVCVLFLNLILIGKMGAGLRAADEADLALRDEAMKTLKKACKYYHGQVASHGGYVYYYSTDLEKRWGEGMVTADTIFVQPPGTPTVGMAFLKAYSATGDLSYLDAALDAAEALVYGQLKSGGWTQVIHFVPPKRGRLGNYRMGTNGNWNASSLDDGQTQAALEMLIGVDQALAFKEAKIHEAILYGLEALLNAQFDNGAFPQVWMRPVERKSIMRARFPEYDWRTVGKVKNYWDYYTLNDGLAGTVSDTLIMAHKVYNDPRYERALKKLGDFLILAQMPDPQPGWCQQYNYEMIPIWARKFEPPAISGWESQDVIETLIKIAKYTGEQKYLEPIPRALEYLKKCLLADGRIARFYEFKTNKPLYMDAEYQLTYDDSAVPRHYGWKHRVRLQEIERSYQEAKESKDPKQPRDFQEAQEDVRRIIGDLDKDGRWISVYAGERLAGQPGFERGFQYISSETFSQNVGRLSEYIMLFR